MRSNELMALAERALVHADGEALVTARSDFRLQVLTGTDRTNTTEPRVRVEAFVVRDGRTGWSVTDDPSDDGLRAVFWHAAHRADAEAGAAPFPGLPAPAAVRGHNGFEPATAKVTADELRALLEAATRAVGRTGAAKGIGEAEVTGHAVGMAATTGLRVTEAMTTSHLRVFAARATGELGVAAALAPSHLALDPERVADRAVARMGHGPRTDAEPGSWLVVLGPEAVGPLLDILGDVAFNGLVHADGRGALAGRLGTRVAAPAINLSDSPRYAGVLAQSVDAEGTPKAPLPLIQDGVAHRVVHDIGSAARAGGGARSTGHALLPGGSDAGPAPRHLVLVGGGAEDEAELAAPLEHGLYVARLTQVEIVDPEATTFRARTHGGTLLIEHGTIGRPTDELAVEGSVLDLLGAVEALSARPRLVRAIPDAFASHGVMCPALRTRGLRVIGPVI